MIVSSRWYDAYDRIGDSTKRWKERLLGTPGKSAIAFLVGFFIVLIPVMGRNYYVCGELILTTSQAGTNFYTGNNPSNTMGSFQHVPFVRPQPMHEEEDFRFQAEARTGRKLTSQEVSSFWFRESFKHIIDSPRLAARVFLQKFTLFWSNVELPDGWDMYFLGHFSPVLRMPLLTFGWILPFSVLGALIWFREKQSVRFLVGFILLYSISVIIFFIFARYRLHIVPPLAVLAALGLQWIRTRVRRPYVLFVMPQVLLAVSVGIFSFFGASMMLGIRTQENISSYANLAEMYQENQDFISAENVLNDAQRREPERASTLCAFGKLYLRSGNPAEAVDYISRCLHADGNYPEAWYLLGVSYMALPNRAAAIRSFQRQLDITPGHQLANKYLENLTGSQATNDHN